MNRMRTTCGAALLAATAALLPATAAHAAGGYDRCVSGDICFFSGDNGSGSMCSWSGDDPDWRNGSIVCSWSADKNVKSVYNHGTVQAYDHVVYYKGANYSDRVGCENAGSKVNLAGTYHVRSHKWTTSC
ncbi:peptidase inhibitor family I36 protein [Streptomyces xanthochromogenes]|uniref:peptidase inhibitor family I36 protein n=1 Tax=Streptomyces xanthochromogenes TaxID=67384 RepID=UPI0038275A53